MINGACIVQSGCFFRALNQLKVSVRKEGSTLVRCKYDKTNDKEVKESFRNSKRLYVLASNLLLICD